MEAHHIQVQKTTRYFVEGNAKANIDVYALHGYGQHPGFFLRKFLPLPEGVRMIAPEGLHRYYLNGNYGRVGASWMTKEDRLHDIEDYVIYLDQVHEAITTHQKTIVLGFSQGAATAVRWVCQGKVHAHKLILWAGSFPQDLDLPSASQKLRSTELILVVGDNDEFIKQPAIKEVRKLLDQHAISYNLIEFKGGHDIDHPTFEQVLEL